jgi:MFS family permease
MSIIALPWVPKLFYGIFTDTFPILGSRKRSYLIMMGMLQCVSSLAVTLYPLATPVHLVFFCMCSELCSAVMDVIVDGLMVIQAKTDPEGGSEDLQSFSWVMFGVGGVVGSLIGGAINNSFNPYWTFYIIAAVGLIISALGLTMDAKLEIVKADIMRMGFTQRSTTVFREIWRGLQLQELHRAAFFFLLAGFVVPSFGDYVYYF